MEEETEPRLFLGCKKEGCNGVLCVSKAARHGMPFQCPRCLNKQKYCADCKQLYINFRRHRQLGHELYEFQRKRQVGHPCPSVLTQRASTHAHVRLRVITFRDLHN